MAEARRSTLSIAVLATAASLGLHAAVLWLALGRAGPAPEAPPRAPVILSLAGPASVRLSAVEASPAASVPAVGAPPVPPPSPPESPPASADAPAAIPPPRLAEVPPPEAEPWAPAAAEVPAADVPRDMSPASSPPLSEAAPPADTGPLSDAPGPAEAPGAEPAAPAIQAAPGAPPVEAPEAPPPPAMAAAQEAPSVAGTAEPPPLAEAAPPVALRAPSAAAVSAAPPTESEAAAVAAGGGPPGPDVPSAEAAPARETPPVSPPSPSKSLEPPPNPAGVRTRDDAVAALEAPALSTEQVRGFVERYDGGPCFFASVTRATPTGTDVEAFSPTVDQVMTFHAAFLGQLGVEPEVVGQRVWKEQCPAVAFLRRTRADGADPLTLRLDRREARSGDVLSGEVRGAGTRRVELALVSETGTVTELSGTARREADGVTAFTILLPPGPPGGPYPEMVIATADPAPARPGTGLAAALSPERPAPPATMRSVAELLLVRR